MDNKKYVVFVIVFIFGIVLGFYFYSPQSVNICDEHGALFLTDNEFSYAYANQLLENPKINLIVVPERKIVYGNSEYLNCENSDFDYYFQEFVLN